MSLSEYYMEDVLENYYDELAENMKKCLREDALSMIENIKKENEELKKEIIECRKMRGEYQRKILEVERSFYKDWKEKKLTKILEKFEDVKNGYELKYDFIKKQKCLECDEDRQITFTSRAGKTIKDSCDCNKTFKRYYAKMIDIWNLGIEKRDNGVIAFLRFRDDTYSTNIDEFILNEKFDKSNSEYTKYTTKEECQKHADFLNCEIEQK